MCAMFAAFKQRLDRSANWLRSPKHFSLCRKGTAALEFALIAAPFLALLVALFETALVFFAGRVLDEVTEEASRYILTGQAQQASMTQTQFQNYLCTSTNTATLVSALWGLLVWKEFAGADSRIKLLLMLMIVLFVIGLGMVAVAPLFGHSS